MIIETLHVDQLLPAPYNPRLTLAPGDQAWTRLERSLNEFDLVQPVVWNRRTGHVVSGHQRLAVLKHRGATNVDCVVVDLSLEKEKALNVTLNNTSVGSDWDTERLVDLIGELQELPDFDATLTGFDEQQLRDLVLTPASDDMTSLPGDEAPPQDFIQLSLEVPQQQWESVEPDLNLLLTNHAGIRLHLHN